MAEPEKMDLASMDVAAEKREELKRCLGQAFPEVFADGGIDFDQLNRVLGEWVEPDKERFGLSWPGKAECMRIIQQPSVATLKPVREDSVNFDETENLFIEGDNLEVLKLLQKPYFGKIKMIYIDPPYNTGGEFIYPDKYSETLDTYLSYTGQIDSGGRKFSTNTDTSGRYHSRWLNMMYPRLYLAKNLLQEDGVVFVSIDENELENLISLMNEVFGEENYISTITWEKGRKNDSTFFSESVEYMIVFAKYKSEVATKGGWRERKPNVDEILSYYTGLRDELGDKHGEIEDRMVQFYQNLDRANPAKKLSHFYRSDKRGLFFGGDISSASTSIPDYDIPHPVTGKPVKKPKRGWGCTEEVMKQRIKEDRVLFGPDETTIPLKKNYLVETDSITKTPVIYKDGRAATKTVSDLLGAKIFDNPKDHNVLADMIRYACPEGTGVILDFFAGSGSTAHAVHLLNQEDNTDHRFIMVQLPEPTEDDSAARRSGYKTISDVGKARIRKVFENEVSSKDTSTSQSDPLSKSFGMRVFDLDQSNFRVWDGDSEKFATDGEQIEMHVDHLADEAKSEDVLYELLLKSGFPLTTKVQSVEKAGKQVFSVEDGALLICLEKEITSELVDALAEANPLQVICLDEGFKGNDQLKANAVQTFKARAQAEESEIVFRTV